MRFAVAGRVTALQRGLCAGISDEGTVFVAHLRMPHASPTTYDDLLVDSFGVLGIAPGDEAWLTGRGADGRLQLWSARDGDHAVVPHPLSAVDAMWAAPAKDAGRELVLSSHLRDGSWQLCVHDREAAISGGPPRSRALALAGSPDTAVVFGCSEKDPLVVAGRIDGMQSATAWALGDGDWRRIHLAPAPSALTSVASAWGGRHTWIGGVLEGRAVVHELLPLPFRGPLRTTAVPMPHLELVNVPEAGGRPLVLVDDVAGDRPVCVAAMARGNRLCWHDGTEWKALPAPDGPVRAACSTGGAVHVLIGQSVWS
ncbi:MAG TPA: hypothetical protein VFI40_05315, partial [Nocardioides sp.]|nr:hypothetical protein [Nocardioides sp.]